MILKPPEVASCTTKASLDFISDADSSRSSDAFVDAFQIPVKGVGKPLRRGGSYPGGRVMSPPTPCVDSEI